MSSTAPLFAHCGASCERGSRCCSRSWRSWPVSATPSTGASWRSSPRWIATSCGVTPVPVGAGVGGLEDRVLSTNAHTIAAVAHRLGEFPRCAAGLREGRLSLDQVGVIAERAAGDPTRTMRRWPQSPRSASCAPRSSSNPDPTPTRSPNRSGRSPRPPTSNPAPGGSPCPSSTPPSSTPRCSPTTTR